MIEAVLALAAGSVSECSAAQKIQIPRAGTVIVYDLEGVTSFGQQIGATTAGVTTFKEFYYSQRDNGQWVVGKSGAEFDAVFGAIPIGARNAGRESFERKRQFQADPIDALSKIKVGETVVLPGPVTFKAKGKKEMQDERPVTAKFLGCFTEQFAGTSERILKYELRLPGIGRRGKEGDIGPVETTATVGISPNLGWLVTYQSKTGSFRAKSIGGEVPTAP